MNHDQNGSSAPQAGNLTDVIGSWVADETCNPFSVKTATLGTIYAEPKRVEEVNFLQLLHALHAGELLKCDDYVKDELLRRISVIDPRNEWDLSSCEKDDEEGTYYVEMHGPCELIKERLAQCFFPSVEEFKNLTEQGFEMLLKEQKEVSVC